MKSLNSFLTAGVAALVLAALSSPAISTAAPIETSTNAESTQPPNVVIIFMDDMGYGDPEFNMGIGYTTPNLNRLAAQGMRFTNFYAAQPTCSASRAGILTGCYPNRVGIYGAISPNEKLALNPKEETIAELLKQAGYATGMVGKWHLGSHAPYLPTFQGFDEYLGLPYSNDMWPVNYDGTPAAPKSHKSKYPPLPLIDGTTVVKTIKTLDDQAQLTKTYTKRACDFLRRSKDKPFFLYLAHSMVHVPIAASPEFRGKSKRGLFGDVMMEIDWSIGQVLKTLDDIGATSNTLVVFTSDNGPWLRFGNHAGNTAGLREGKGTTWEGGVREACVMRWPGHIPAGVVCNKMASTIDLLPTIVKITGAPSPQKKIDGVNILPLLENVPGANPRNEFVYYYRKNDLECIRRGQWKLVFPHRGQTYKKVPPGHDGFPSKLMMDQVPMALYNLAVDPGESNDVQKQFPEIVKELETLADTYRQDLGDDLTKVKGTGHRPAATW